MKAILSGKLYDTEKSDFVFGVSIPQYNFHDDVNEFNVYRTKKRKCFCRAQERRMSYQRQYVKNYSFKTRLC